MRFTSPPLRAVPVATLPRMACRLLASAALLLLLAVPARAQIDSREAIALQNQILQLRQEVEQLRRGGVAAR